MAKKGIAQPTQQRQYLDVERDGAVLTDYLVGGNILREGTDPKLKPDTEYPEWLWSMRTVRGAKPLEEIEPDSEEYWRYMKVKDRLRRKMTMKKNHKYKIFKARFTNEPNDI